MQGSHVTDYKFCTSLTTNSAQSRVQLLHVCRCMAGAKCPAAAISDVGVLGVCKVAGAGADELFDHRSRFVGLFVFPDAYGGPAGGL